MSIVIFIVSLAILILVHEFGHFIVAKKSGIRVDEFGLGFPPRLISKKWGDTTYTLNAIPFGGFVKIFGEDMHSGNISELDRSRSFQYKPKWIQALVLVAGVSMNLIFAWLLISLGFMLGLPSPVEHSGFGEVRDAHVTIVEILPGSQADKAGLYPGDTIISVRGGGVTLQNDTLTLAKISELISESKIVDITYRRGDTPTQSISVQGTGEVGNRMIGVALQNIGTLELPVHLALIEGLRTTALLTKETTIGLAKFLSSVVTLKSDFSQVSGPVGIAGVVGQAQTLGFVHLLSLIALISINLPVINLIPFPALDGGRLLFVGIEAIIRRPIPAKIVRYTNAIGFLLLLTLMVVVTTNDIFKLL